MEKELILSKDVQDEYRNKAIEYLDLMGVLTDLDTISKNQFIERCSILGLNPLLNEIYPVTYGKKLQVITSYEVFISRAEASGLLDGWSVETDGEAFIIETTIKPAIVFLVNFTHLITGVPDES